MKEDIMKNEYFEPLEICDLKLVETDFKKLKQVLHYIVNEVGGKANVGKTVLYKLLYFCDFEYYLKYEQFLTGENYRKIDHGPAPIDFDQIVNELRDEKKVEWVDGAIYYGKPQNKLISLQSPNIDILSAQEIKLIDLILDEYSDYNGKQIEKISHNDTPWKATQYKEIINYNLVFYRDSELTEDEEDDC